MKTMHIIPVFILSLLLACSSTKDDTGMWVNKKKNGGRSYQKLFIIASTADIQQRVLLEKNMSAAALAIGYTTVKSIDAIPPSLNDPKPPSKEIVLAAAKLTGCDALSVVYILTKDEGINYTPGVAAGTVNTDGILTGLLGMALKRDSYTNKGYSSSQGTTYQIASKPSSFTVTKDYYIISDLFDAGSEEIVCSARSDKFDEANINSFAMNYMTGLLKQLEKNKILKK